MGEDPRDQLQSDSLLDYARIELFHHSSITFRPSSSTFVRRDAKKIHSKLSTTETKTTDVSSSMHDIPLCSLDHSSDDLQCFPTQCNDQQKTIEVHPSGHITLYAIHQPCSKRNADTMSKLSIILFRSISLFIAMAHRISVTNWKLFYQSVLNRRTRCLVGTHCNLLEEKSTSVILVDWFQRREKAKFRSIIHEERCSLSCLFQQRLVEKCIAKKKKGIDREEKDGLCIGRCCFL